LDENLEPNFEKISDRINRLPVAEELKKDMLDGVQFCKQFAVRSCSKSQNFRVIYLNASVPISAQIFINVT
jgi:hypothetical protein